MRRDMVRRGDNIGGDFIKRRYGEEWKYGEGGVKGK